jgi:PDZ domain-containing protein
MKRLGLDVALVEGKILVEELVCEGAPTTQAACTELAIGETIVGFNGVKVGTLTELAAQMKGLVAGTRVTLSVLPYEPDEDKSVEPDSRTIQLMKSPDDPNRVIIGFVPSDTRSVRVPFDVQISTAGIGGPSAGLAFTLSLLDELTPGNLMGRGRVVATGTINEDGSVGAIGALEQKAVAVKDAGGTLFLVPAGQSASEMKAARDAVSNSVTIVQVGTVEEALVQLAKNGGDGLPAPPK